ncbi:MAG: flippase activity-associated protein Agl23 [Verrucomicrobiota bacterium]
MKHAVIIVLWIGVFVTGAFLRFDHLAQRPFHADEATGTRIAARRMESGAGQFDPTHFHGPLLADLAIPLCRLRGETSWKEMTKGTLRTLPAIAGSLLVLVPLLWRRRCGDGPMLLAAAALATSPLLVYYSRMFIHESLLVLFGMLALMALARKPRWGIPGLLLGLMFATKESFAFSVLAWAAAGLLLAWQNRRELDRKMLAAAWRDYRLPVAVSLVVAAVTALGFYTDGFRHPQGAIDAVRTYFVYQTGEGHDKPFGYYFQLLALPKKSGGVWWFETPVLVLALAAWAATFRRGPEGARCRFTIRFIAYAAVGHFLIYSLIAYKTPWLACLAWAHVCLLAGFAVAGLAVRRRPLQAALAVVAGGCLVTSFYQARRATGRYAADERNPYAYVPTRSDIEKLESWLLELRRVVPAGALEPVAVIGEQYWPLPWYLRAFDRIGYWRDPPQGLSKLPLVFALPEATAGVMPLLAKSHRPLPRGLRTGVPVYVFVRNDLWKQWMDSDTR